MRRCWTFMTQVLSLAECRALDSLTATIHAGENVAIIGPNGSGKSTLIKLITRELYPLAVNGEPPVRISGREHVGYLPAAFAVGDRLRRLAGLLPSTAFRAGGHALRILRERGAVSAL